MDTNTNRRIQRMTRANTPMKARLINNKHTHIVAHANTYNESFVEWFSIVTLFVSKSSSKRVKKNINERGRGDFKPLERTISRCVNNGAVCYQIY